MSQTQYGTLITSIGLAKIANAQVTQSKVGLENIALGDGNGAHYVPTQNQTALVNEVWRGQVAEVSIDPKNNNRIIIDAVIPVTVGGFTIREIGVFDDEGHLIAVGQYPEKYKPQLSEGVSEETIIHFVIETNNANVVKLNIDPTVIIASKDYVDKKFNNLDSRIGDTKKLETDYRKDTVGAINEVHTELSKLIESMGGNEPKSAVLERGANAINAPIKTLSSVTALEGRTIVNYAPLLDSGLWETYQATVNVGGPDTVTVPAGKWYATLINTRILTVKPNTVYTLSARHNGKIAIIDAFDFNIFLGESTNQTLTFNTGELTAVRIVLTAPSTAAATFENVMLNEGSMALPFVANVQGITNPTIENVRHNLIPAFNLNSTDIYTPGWLFLTSIDAVNSSATFKGKEDAFVLLQVVPGTKYTFSCQRKATVHITTNNGSQLSSDQLTTLFIENDTQDGPMSCTFTVPIDTNFIRMGFYLVDNDTGYVSQPMLVKGTVPAPYKEQVREALTLKTTLYTGDKLRLDAAGRLVKQQKTREQLLTDDLTYKIYAGMSAVGGKLVYISGVAKYMSTTDQKAIGVKYNGSLLPFDGYKENVDRMGYSAAEDRLYISISNNDSGWGPAYAPTDAEVKAYFLGWKMYDGNAWANPYNGTGTKYWGQLKTTGSYVEGSSTTTLPTTSNPNIPPYKVVYTLQDPTTEVVETVGSLTLDEGENLLVVSEGRIVQEVANIQMYNGAYYVNGTGKPLKNKVARIVQVYKNGKAINTTIRATDAVDIGKIGVEYAIIRDYDPTAVYTVDYLPLYPYMVTAHANPITVEYADNVGSALQLLTKKVAGLETRMSNAESAQAKTQTQVQQQAQNVRFGRDAGGLYILLEEEALQ